MSKLLLVIKSMRLRQWVKNMFIFMPFIFGGKIFNANSFLFSVFAFIVFCLASSGIYLLNDIKDIATDRFHPGKKNRPIASGRLNTKTAFISSVFFIVLSLSCAFAINRTLMIITLIYIVAHIIYNYWLKQKVIIDIMIIALGFELRILAGCAVTSIVPSIWLQLCVFLLALFLGFLKRKNEKISLDIDAEKHRNVLSDYNLGLLDQLITISATLCIVFYGFYSVSADLTKRLGNNYMAYTIPFVIYGIFRYLFVVTKNSSGGDPGEILITDTPLIITILMWISVSILLIYNHF